MYRLRYRTQRDVIVYNGLCDRAQRVKLTNIRYDVIVPKGNDRATPGAEEVVVVEVRGSPPAEY